MEKMIHGCKVQIINGDLTEMDTDAIVNAANTQLMHGGGVAGAISRKGGPSIQEESTLWVKSRGSVPVGGCAITSAGNLNTRYVIHAVGPRMGEGNEDEKLKSATLSSLKMADEHQLKSIAFPAISTGIFGYPIERCAPIMLSSVADYLKGHASQIEWVVFCLWGEKAYGVFERGLGDICEIEY